MSGLPFHITPISRPPPAHPADMTLPELRAFVAGGGRPAIVQEVRDAMVSRFQSLLDRLPPSLLQRGGSCQAVAVINGLRAYQALAAQPALWEPTDADIQALRARAARFEAGEPLAWSPRSVGDILVAEGALSACTQESNPIVAARAMGQRGFAVVVKGSGIQNVPGGARTIVPNFSLLRADGAWPADFAVLSPYTAEQTPLDAEAYADLFLTQDGARGDQILVCRT